MVAPAQKQRPLIGCHGLPQGVKEFGGEDSRRDVTFYFCFARMVTGPSNCLPHECPSTEDRKSCGLDWNLSSITYYLWALGKAPSP